MRRISFACALAAIGLLWTGAAPLAARQTTATPTVFQGPAVEQFLATARIVAMKDLPTGVTRPRKATLEAEGVTRYAVFKWIDQQPAVGVQHLADGTVEANFEDSWRTEVAAYELDKLIGLGLVPATVPRSYEGTSGSLQLWVDSLMTEKKRQDTNTAPPDVTAWNNQMATLFVWDNLIYNTDRNLDNLLITPAWQLVAIDHSRTFRPYGSLKDAKLMTRFSRALLARMDALTEPILKARLNEYLTPYQIQDILKRRDAIDQLVKKLVAEKGAAAVLYD
jgi:hypothetical protein